MYATGNEINITAYSDALVVLGTAGVLIPIIRRWGLNPVLGYLAAGTLLGPFGLGSFIDKFHPLYWIAIVDPANVAAIGELGIVFLLFVIGLELSPQRLSSMRTLVGGLGSLQVLLCTLAITAAALLMGLPLPVAILLGAGLSLSSTAIVLELLSKQNRLATNAGRATFAVLLAQDIAAIPILMFVSLGASGSGGSVLTSLVEALLQAGVAIAIIVILGRYLLRPLFRVVAATHSTDLFVATVLFVIVSAGVLAHEAGLSMALGAFIAGLLLAETPFRKAVEASIDPFKGLLIGVFFFTVGMRIDVRVILREPLLILACVAGVIVIKTILVAALGRLFRLSWPSAIEAGLLLGPGGEFAFVIVGMAADLNVVSGHIAALALAVTSLSMVTTPGLDLAARRLSARLRQNVALDPALLATPEPHASCAIVVGFGRVGKVVCELLAQRRITYVATDYDPDIVVANRGKGYRVYYGDAIDPKFLKICGLDDAAAIIITINAREAVNSIVALVRSLRADIPIIVRARDADHARHLYAIGATDVVPETIEASLQLSEAALIGMGIDTAAAREAVERKRLAYRQSLRSAPPHDEEE